MDTILYAAIFSIFLNIFLICGIIMINKRLQKAKDDRNLNLKVDLNDNYNQEELFKTVMNSIKLENIFCKDECYCIKLNKKIAIRTKNISATDTLFVPTDDVKAFYVHAMDVFTEVEYHKLQRKFAKVIEEVRKTNEMTRINKNKNFIFDAIIS